MRIKDEDVVGRYTFPRFLYSDVSSVFFVDGAQSDVYVFDIKSRYIIQTITAPEHRLSTIDSICTYSFSGVRYLFLWNTVEKQCAVFTIYYAAAPYKLFKRIYWTMPASIIKITVETPSKNTPSMDLTFAILKSNNKTTCLPIDRPVE